MGMADVKLALHQGVLELSKVSLAVVRIAASMCSRVSVELPSLAG